MRNLRVHWRRDDGKACCGRDTGRLAASPGEITCQRCQRAYRAEVARQKLETNMRRLGIWAK